MSNKLPRKPRGTKKLQSELKEVQEAMNQALRSREEMARDAVINAGFTLDDIPRGRIVQKDDEQVFWIDETAICVYTEPMIVNDGKQVVATFKFKAV